jgi:hypothetical protein
LKICQLVEASHFPRIARRGIFSQFRWRMAFESFRDFVNAPDRADSRLRATGKGIYSVHGRN